MAIAQPRRSPGASAIGAVGGRRAGGDQPPRRLDARAGGLVGGQKTARDVTLDLAELRLVEGRVGRRRRAAPRAADERPDRGERRQPRHSR